jgi:hypothetical protein
MIVRNNKTAVNIILILLVLIIYFTFLIKAIIKIAQ